MSAPGKAAAVAEPKSSAGRARSFTPSRSVFLQRKCTCAGGGTECETCRKKPGEQTMQRAAAGAIAPASAPPVVNQVLSSPGRALDSSARSFMEPRFGQDFSGVRIHTGPQAAESARAVDAHAYTVGQDIVFDHGVPYKLVLELPPAGKAEVWAQSVGDEAANLEIEKL